jgi:hypothetical protein
MPDDVAQRPDLALESAENLVNAMATDNWIGVKERFTSAFDLDRWPYLEHRLESDHGRLKSMAPANQGATRGLLVQEWRTRLADLLDQDAKLAGRLRPKSPDTPDHVVMATQRTPPLGEDIANGPHINTPAMTRAAPQAAASSGRDGPHFTRKQIVALVAGVPVAVGATVALVQLTNLQFISAIFLACCWIPLGITFAVPQWRGWTTWTNAILLTIVLAAIGFIFKFQAGRLNAEPKPAPAPTITATVTATATVAPTPPDAPHIVFTHPAAGDTAPVDGCFTVTWHGDPPSGWAYAVGTRAPGDDLTYFEGRVVKTPNGDWSATVTLGDNGKGMGLTYQVAIIMLKKEMHDYLETAQGSDDITYWVGSENPPDSQPVANLAPTRNKKSALGGNC